MMFRAPMDTFHLDNAPPFINQLLSEESLRRTGYFDPAAVAKWRQRLPSMSKIGYARTAVEMGLMGVTATQLWHQTFIDQSLADMSFVTRHSSLAGVNGFASDKGQMTGDKRRAAS
jgi:asparagine synthase (glutamine-hydrolysing)